MSASHHTFAKPPNPPTKMLLYKLIILHSLFSYSTVGSLGVLYILSVTNHDCTKLTKYFLHHLLLTSIFALSKV